MIEDSMAKTCKLYLPVVRTLEITKIIDFNQADYYTRGIVFVYLFFGSEFRLVNYFDSEIVRSLSAYFGKTRSEIWQRSREPNTPSFTHLVKCRPINQFPDQRL